MMALENNLVVDSDAELKAFLSSILSSEGIVVNINRTFIAYNNGTNRNRVFARCANRMAQKGTDEKFVVIALMCYPALNWILKARDIDAMIEQLHDMDTDGSVRNISEIQSLLENSTGYVKPRLHLEIHTEINPEPSEILDVLADESEPIVPPAPKSASTPQNADAAEPFDSADIFEPELEPEPKPEKESVFDLPVDDDDTQDPFAENSDSHAGLSFDPSGIDMDDDKKDPFAEDDGNVFNPPDDVDEHEEEPDMDMMDFDIPASSEPDTVDSPAIEQKPPMPDKVPDLPAKETNAFGTSKAVVAEPKAKPHEPAKPVESHPTQPRPQKPDVPQTPKAEPKAEPVAPAQRPKADREAALAGFNITRKVEPSKEVKKPKKPITDKRTSTSKSSPKEDSAKAPKQKQPSKEAPAKSQKKPANGKQQNSDEPKKAQPFDQSFRKRGRGSSKKAQQSNGQISFEELH